MGVRALGEGKADGEWGGDDEPKVPDARLRTEEAAGLVACTCYLSNVDFVYPGRTGSLAIQSASILVVIGFPSCGCRVCSSANLIRISV